MTETDPNQIVILQTPSQELLSSCSLVLSAMGISHTISTVEGKHQILVSEDDEQLAAHHLSRYQAENKNWPPPKNELKEQSSSNIQPPTLIVISALILFYSMTGPWNKHSEWFINGAGNADAILYEGEYYRLITALTLHADLTHLLGNCFLGGFLIHFFCRTVGPGFGVFSILVSAVLGNFINVYLHGTNHHFVGFSTAVFSTIGMLVMASYNSNRKVASYQVFAPFMAGIALLAMTGSSGERTDLGAHLFGLFAGFFIGGLLFTDIGIKLRSSPSLQLFLFFFTCIIVYFSWDQAMATVY